MHVPYKGAPQGVLAVMTGEVTMGFFNTPTVISQIRGGKVKALGVTSLTRSPLLPDVPTLDELGVRGYEVNTWFGFVAPAGTPPDIVARLNSEMNAIFATARGEGESGVARLRSGAADGTCRLHEADPGRHGEVDSDREGLGGDGELGSRRHMLLTRPAGTLSPRAGRGMG